MAAFSFWYNRPMESVLYRKYRPQNFHEVLGQEQIVSVLKSAIEQETFAHAYLFTGSRGTGKTSVARILARELGTNPEDIIEIDAASNRGIDDIRALREAVRVLPFSSQYKVYIIDEVHMLSKDAFNALLKTLEEPPAHVVFILATTELEKVPETIISRCQVFRFQKPSRSILIEMIKRVAEAEHAQIDEESAEIIAFLGDGSFRDTFGSLQKVLSVAKGRVIDRALVESVTGAPSLVLVHDLYTALIEEDIDAAYRTLHTASDQRIDMSVLTKLLLQTIRLSLMYRYAPSLRESLLADHSEQYKELVIKGAVDGAKTITSASIVAFITALERMSYAAVSELPLELAFVELITEKSLK